jgi:hypothetical protein
VEAHITVNGTTLTDTESAVVRVALAALAEVLAEGLGVRDDRVALTDRYLSDVSRVRALIQGRALRTQ